MSDLRNRPINTAVFECTKAGGEQFEFTIRRGPGELALWLPLAFNRPYLVLSQVADKGDMTDEFREGDVVLRFDAGRVHLTVGSERFMDCAENHVRSIWEHAKLSGVDFRGAGIDPIWYVEIRRGGNIVFSIEGESARLTAPTPEPQIDVYQRAVYRVHVDGHDLVVTVGGSACPAPDRSDMSGTTAVVSLDNQTYSGCGRALH